MIGQKIDRVPIIIPENSKTYLTDREVFKWLEDLINKYKNGEINFDEMKLILMKL